VTWLFGGNDGAPDGETWAYAAPLPGDFDGDGDVDGSDYGPWSACMTGPASGLPATGCEPGDFDADADVDLADFSGLQAAILP
jgi:hypothetical protein